MTTRVADIITRARDTLADPKKERWSDDRLLRLLDEAQKDFARQTSLLKGYATIPVLPADATLTLPEECWLLTRAHYEEQVLPLYSHERMDEIDLAWYTRRGDKIEALVFDRRNESVVRCYPILDITSDNDIFGVLSSYVDFAVEPVYGVVTDYVDGVVNTAMLDPIYGVVTDISSDSSLAVFYIRDPKTVSGLTDELEISSRWDIALKNYVVGHAFIDDLDTQYQARGSTALSLYDRELNLAKQSARHDSTAAQVFETSYNGGLRW